MKLPEYTLKVGVEIPTGPMSDPIEFAAGTLCHPFWSNHNLPEHIRKLLDDHVKFMKDKNQYIMCLIGRTWVIVKKEDIRSN